MCTVNHLRVIDPEYDAAPRNESSRKDHPRISKLFSIKIFIVFKMGTFIFGFYITHRHLNCCRSIPLQTNCFVHAFNFRSDGLVQSQGRGGIKIKDTRVEQRMIYLMCFEYCQISLVCINSHEKPVVCGFAWLISY